MLFALSLAFMVSLFVGMLVIRFEHLHRHLTGDSDMTGPQKFHAMVVPRIGGIPIAAGLVAGMLLAGYLGYVPNVWLIVLVAAPAFLGGLADDISKRIGPLPRLLAVFFAAGLGYCLLDAQLLRVNIPWVDEYLLVLAPISFVLTLFTVGGVANAINIIDGYNGLSGMVTLIITSAMAFIAFEVGDYFVMIICLSLIGGILGFLVWNFPYGLIFAGDGGAYLIGFMIGELALLLMARNPEVSAWALLLLTIYPVFETVFSVYRRKFLQRRPVGYPDSLHLHQMIYRRLVRWMVGRKEARLRTRRNALTSIYLWFLTLLSVLPAVLFWNYTPALVLCVLLFIFIYVRFYWRLVRFKAPRKLIFRGRSAELKHSGPQS